MFTECGNGCRSSEVNIVKDFSKKTYSGCFTSRTFLTLWIVMLCLSTAGYCQRVWKKYEESPIIFSFGNNSKSLSEKPFPVVTGHFKNPSFAHGRKTLKWRQDKNETFSNNWNLENGYQLPEDDTGTTTPVVICNASEQCFGNVKSSCGGVLCILLSFTVLSLVEIICYLSVYFSNKRRIMLSQASSISSIDCT